MYIIEEEKDTYGIDFEYVIYDFDMETGERKYITYFKNYEVAKEHVSELIHNRIEKRKESLMDLKSIEKNGDTLTFLWKKGEPIVLTKAKEDKENLGTAFLYAYFMHIMGWSKAETHRFLDQLETSQDKKTREAKEKKDRQAKKVKEEEARKLKEYNKKVKKEAMRNIKETQFLRDVDKYIKEMK